MATKTNDGFLTIDGQAYDMELLSRAAIVADLPHYAARVIVDATRSFARRDGDRRPGSHLAAKVVVISPNGSERVIDCWNSRQINDQLGMYPSATVVVPA